MISRTTAVMIICCCLLVSTVASAAVVGATQGNASSTPVDSNDPPATTAGCFPAEGYEFTIGNQGPEINMILHLSVLTNLGGPGAFGIELTGSIGGPSIIELRTGVLFAGIDSVSEFLNNPFEPFSIAFEYMFERLTHRLTARLTTLRADPLTTCFAAPVSCLLQGRRPFL